MREAAEIKSEFAAAEELPELERDTRRGLLLLEVILDIREKLDHVESWAISIDTHVEKMREGE